MNQSGEILVKQEGDVATITLNRPGKGNALTESLLESLGEAIRRLRDGGGTRCAVLGGAGEKTFSVGMDLSAMAGQTPEANCRLLGPGGPLRRAIAGIEGAPFPVIGMINGYALGAACELALSCDLRVGSEGSKMGMPPGKLGIVYPTDGLKRILRAVGFTGAMKLFLTAGFVGAAEAKEMGMLQYVVAGADLEGFVFDLARTVARLAPLSASGHKRALRMLEGSWPPTGNDEAELESLVLRALESADAREGLAAFFEKRPPRFTGL